jgi:eukaryotic-like serine/threonine-protein kinase
MAVNTAGQLLAGRYRVLGRLGTGGMATVFLCEDTRLGRRVAVKRLHAESPADTARRFRREAKLGASLNHMNVVSIFDTVTDDDGVLIVMEYVDGETLGQLLRREGRLAPERALEILHGLAAALDHAHGRGVVHRDVKPANVLIGSGGEVKLVDLGISAALEGTRITHSGTVLGTASYMAPEQIDGATPGPAADIYSLATLAFEMLSGRKAREGKTPVEIAQKIVSQPPPSLDEAWTGAPDEAVGALCRAMATDPGDRPPTAGAFVADLERAFDGAPRHEQAAAPLAAPAPPAEPVPAVPATNGDRAAPTTYRAPDSTPEARPSRSARTRVPAAPPRRPEPVRQTHRGGRERAWLVPAALVALLAFAIAGFMLLSGGGGDDGDGGSGTSGQQPAQRSDRSERGSGKRDRDAEQPSGDAAPAPAPEPAPSGEGAYQVPEATGDDPSRGAQLNDQGKSLIDQGRPGEAIPVLEDAVRSFPAGSGDLNYAYALFNLGNALRLAGRPEDAVPVLERRLEIDNQRGAVQAELERARAEARGR